jgi:hypothetical protein
MIPSVALRSKSLKMLPFKQSGNGMGPDILSQDRVVIGQPWGGLGDNLQFSTLPERFVQVGRKVYVSTANAVRNSEIHQLVWGSNPHIEGILDAPPTAGACRSESYSEGGRHHCFIHRIERAHGFEPRCRYPRIYYIPKHNAALSELVMLDLGSTTNALQAEVLLHYVKFVFKQFGYSPKHARQVCFSKDVCTQNRFRLDGVTPHPVNSLIEYCDVLASCRALVTVHSGAHALAVTVRQEAETPTIHCIVSALQYNWRNHIFDGVEYQVV